MQSTIARRAALLILAIGLSACNATISETAICEAVPIKALASALVAHPETPALVGNAAVDVVIGFRQGCGR
jgi:hypothetical protein